MSQAANTTPSAPAKLQSQHAKFELRPLDDNGDNYTQWCKMTTLMLKYKGLWDIVDGSTLPPEPADAQAHLEWTRRDQEAQLQIMTALNSAPLNHVLDAKSAKDVWDLLRIRYQGDDDLRQHYLLERLFTIAFRDSDPMEPQIAEVVSIARQLTDIGFPITDQLLAGAIRIKLPESWNTLKTVLANTGGTAQTSKGVISQILAEEHRHVHAAGGDASAYFAKAAPKGKKKRGKKTCSYCKNKGHTASECRKREQEEKPSGSNSSSNGSSGKTSGKSSSGKSSKASSRSSSSRPSSSRTTDSARIVAADSDSDSSSDSDDTVQVFMARATLDEDVERVYKTKAELRQCNLQHGWLIDSGASRTMCSHRGWFSHFTPLSRHTRVVLGDNSAIPAVGSGRLSVRMFANGKWINSVLQDVLYVPDLHGNLLSVSHLVRRGAEVRFLGEDCHVYDRRKSLILEGGLRNNLYVMKLQVSGPVTANVTTFDSDIMDITQPADRALTMRLTSSCVSLDLWHRRLGHLHTNAVTHMADEGLVTSMTISDREAPAGPCTPCLEGKQT